MRKFLRIFSIILLVLWMGLIFFLSSQTADASSQTSGQVIEVLAEKFYPDFEGMTDSEKEAVVSSLQFAVRKATHIGIFAVLGFLAFLTFISYVNLRFATRIFWATALSCLYAASDEFHQRFVTGRSCELRDFLLDTAGILGAVLICSLFVKIVAPLRRKTAFEGVTKKILISLNNELYEKLNDSFSKTARLEEQISEQSQIIEKLEKQLQWQPKAINEEESETVMADEQIQQVATQQFLEDENSQDDNIKAEVILPDDTEYAAKVIGECVVEVTRVCNIIATSNQDSTKKELVNLALGRTEVLKSQILRILDTQNSFEEKKDLIENEKQEAYDYLNSITAQIC